jgi:hypothetical protein
MYGIAKLIGLNCIQKIVSICAMLFFFNVSSFSQSIQREVFSSAGNFNAASSIYLQSNIGELIIETYENSNIIVSQGFEQNDPLPLGLNSSEFNIVEGKVFPNPMFSDLNIVLDFIDTTDLVIEVFDVKGEKQVFNLQKVSLIGKIHYELHFENIGVGLYFVVITGEKNQFNRTFKITKI